MQIHSTHERQPGEPTRPLAEHDTNRQDRKLLALLEVGVEFKGFETQQSPGYGRLNAPNHCPKTPRRIQADFAKTSEQTIRSSNRF
jgi:hypothetical protein